jgi:hypothetical protein
VRKCKPYTIAPCLPLHRSQLRQNGSKRIGSKITDDNSRHNTYSHSTGFMNKWPKKRASTTGKLLPSIFFSIHMATFTKMLAKNKNGNFFILINSSDMVDYVELVKLAQINE